MNVHAPAPGDESNGNSSAPFERALLGILPGRAHRLLLMACLADGDAAMRAWCDFAAMVGDPKGYFEADQLGLKGLLPFLGSRLMANHVDAGKAFQTYARVALVREELRGRIYQDILGSVLGGLDGRQISTVLLKAGALSATVYPQPSARHNHAIDLLVEEARMTAARDVLLQLGFTQGAAGPGAAWHQTYRHWTGLALGLHARPLFLPHFEMPDDAVRARARSVEIGSFAACVMSPEDSLVHICGHATYSRSRANLRWACDAFYLIRGSPALDWKCFIRNAAAARVALQAFVLLRWLTDALGASVPPPVLSELRLLASRIDAVAAEGILASLLHTHASWLRALDGCRGDPRMMREFLRFSALPSARYLQWRYNSSQNWKLPFYYLRRPVRFGIGLLRYRTGQTSGAQTSPPSTNEGVG